MSFLDVPAWRVFRAMMASTFENSTRRFFEQALRGGAAVEGDAYDWQISQDGEGRLVFLYRSKGGEWTAKGTFSLEEGFRLNLDDTQRIPVSATVNHATGVNSAVTSTTSLLPLEASPTGNLTLVHTLLPQGASGANVKFRYNLAHWYVGAAQVNTLIDEVFAVVNGASQARQIEFPVEARQGMAVRVTITRLGTDAADTFGGTIVTTAASFTFNNVRRLEQDSL